MLQTLKGIRVHFSTPLPCNITIVKNWYSAAAIVREILNRLKTPQFPEDLVYFVLNVVVKAQVLINHDAKVFKGL